MLSKCSTFGKKDDVAQVEKIPACSENRVSEKALLQFICLDQEHGSCVQTKFGTYKLQYILNVYSYKAVPLGANNNNMLNYRSAKNHGYLLNFTFSRNLFFNKNVHNSGRHA